MTYKHILMVAVLGLALMATMNCQPRTYSINIVDVRQPEGRLPVSEGIPLINQRYSTFSGAPVFIEFEALGFECPDQNMSFKISYMYRRVRPTNFLTDPSLYVMEGFVTTTTVISGTCSSSWTSPPLRDGIHTIGILAFDGSGAQSPWYYVTIVKNNERGRSISIFPGGDEQAGEDTEEPPIEGPVVIIDTPGQKFIIGSDPIQYVDIHFHTNYPFPVEYFYVTWTFTSDTECTYSSSAVVYPSEFNRGVFHLDMSAVFASEWDEPQDQNGKCMLTQGEFVVSVFCKTGQGLGSPSTVTISLL